jgi:hypothetical protein
VVAEEEDGVLIFVLIGAFLSPTRLPPASLFQRAHHTNVIWIHPFGTFLRLRGGSRAGIGLCVLCIGLGVLAAVKLKGSDDKNDSAEMDVTMDDDDDHTFENPIMNSLDDENPTE